jgi:hypothetical protein
MSVGALLDVIITSICFGGLIYRTVLSADACFHFAVFRKPTSPTVSQSVEQMPYVLLYVHIQHKVAVVQDHLLLLILLEEKSFIRFCLQAF